MKALKRVGNTYRLPNVTLNDKLGNQITVISVWDIGNSDFYQSISNFCRAVSDGGGLVLDAITKREGVVKHDSTLRDLSNSSDMAHILGLRNIEEYFDDEYENISPSFEELLYSAPNGAEAFQKLIEADKDHWLKSYYTSSREDQKQTELILRLMLRLYFTIINSGFMVKSGKMRSKFYTRYVMDMLKARLEDSPRIVVLASVLMAPKIVAALKEDGYKTGLQYYSEALTITK